MPSIHHHPRLSPTRYLPTRDASPETVLRLCPECGSPLVRASACVTCRHCGWGRCG
jgi:hypothetical protein